jgi:succinyl-CoA synthetase alpha subunit
MSILVNKTTRVAVQGITGNEGLFHTQQMVNYGTNIVAGISPGKGGEWVMSGKIPVFDSVKLAVDATGADTTVIFVPARYAPDAIYEAVDAGISMIVCITEGIPIQDMMKVTWYCNQHKTILIGPNCPGILTPKICKIGIIPGNITQPGDIGLISRSGTLTYEVLWNLKQDKKGISTCVGIGGDPVKGSSFIDMLGLFEADPDTEKIVLIGEIGGTDEEQAADYISNHVTKPVVSFIAGQSAPPGKRMGHAGAIIDGSEGSALSKIIALESVGVKVARQPEEIINLLGS